MTDTATLADQLSDIQFRAIAALLTGPATAETGVSRMGLPVRRRVSGAAVRPYIWWGRLMKELPAGLVSSEWRAREQQLLWSLTPLGSDVLKTLTRSGEGAA